MTVTRLTGRPIPSLLDGSANVVSSCAKSHVAGFALMFIFVQTHDTKTTPMQIHIRHRASYAIVLYATFFAAAGCAGSGRGADIISDNISNAKVQIGALLSASEDGGALRIPSSYQDGHVVYVPKDDWVSGFFAGTLWYMYDLTGERSWADHAWAHTQALDSIQYLTWHHDVGFMVYDSFGNALRYGAPDSCKNVIVQAAKSLSTRFRPGAGVLQSWDADRGWQAQRGWTCPVIIDNMMNLELLFNASSISGDPKFRDIAISHADRTLANHFREDGSCWHVVDYDPETGEVLHRCTAQGYADWSAWARGQAWALYGFTAAYRYTGYERYLQQARKVAGYILHHPRLPADKVPYWDFDDPDIPDTYRDVSSAAIIASALYDLYSCTSVREYLDGADDIMVSLSSPAYRAAPGTDGGFILMHSVGSLPHGSGVDVPLNYADYYFLEALIRKRNLTAK